MKAALSCSSSKYRSLIKRKSVATSIVKALRSLVVYAKYTRREPEGLFRAIHLKRENRRQGNGNTQACVSPRTLLDLSRR